MNADTISHLLELYGYAILIPLSFIEGPLVSFVAGALSALGYFNPFIAFFVFIFKDICVDGAYYCLGRYGGKSALGIRFLRKVNITPDRVAEISKAWNENTGKAMFVSKFAWGLSPLFLSVAGIIQMPYVRFFTYATIVAFFHYGVLFLVGFFFGSSFGSLAGIIKNIQFALAGLVFTIIVFYGVKWYLGRKLIK